MRRFLLLALVAGCAAAQTKPYAPVVVPEMQPAAAAHATGVVKAANALSVAPAPAPMNPPLRPLTDPRMLTVRLPDDAAFGFVRQSQGDQLVTLRVANQVECQIMQESQVIMMVQLANYLETLPGGAYQAQRIDTCLGQSGIADRLDIDYRVRELLPHGLGPTGSKANLQNGKDAGWKCSVFGRFYRCPKDRLEDVRGFLMSPKITALAGATMPPKFADLLDGRIVNGKFGWFCKGGKNDSKPCTSNGTCGDGKCVGGDFTIPDAPMPFDSTAFFANKMSSSHFIEKPDAAQLALLDEAERRHAYASARVCDPTLPPGLSAQETHLQLEASAHSPEQQMLFTIDPFVGDTDPRWSVEDRCALFAAVHIEGHMPWGEAVKVGDGGAAGIFSYEHSGGFHRIIMRKSANFRIRPLCTKLAQGNLIDVQACPDMTGEAYLVGFKQRHPNYREEIRRMAGL